MSIPLPVKLLSLSVMLIASTHALAAPYDAHLRHPALDADAWLYPSSTLERRRDKVQESSVRLRQLIRDFGLANDQKAEMIRRYRMLACEEVVLTLALGAQGPRACARGAGHFGVERCAANTLEIDAKVLETCQGELPMDEDLQPEENAEHRVIQAHARLRLAHASGDEATAASARAALKVVADDPTLAGGESSQSAALLLADEAIAAADVPSAEHYLSAAERPQDPYTNAYVAYRRAWLRWAQGASREEVLTSLRDASVRATSLSDGLRRTLLLDALVADTSWLNAPPPTGGL